jgi:hypothetical protein
MRRALTVTGFTAGCAAAGYLCFRGLLSGALSLDLRVGRRTRPLGPLTADIEAPRETVFGIMARPYLDRRPDDAGENVRILVAGQDLVLAAHRVPLPGGQVVSTVETVRFTRPERIDFRLIRGPVAQAAEAYELTSRDGGCRLTFTGRIDTDLWSLGEVWGRLVAERWETVVRDFIADVKAEAES